MEGLCMPNIFVHQIPLDEYIQTLEENSSSISSGFAQKNWLQKQLSWFQKAEEGSCPRHSNLIEFCKVQPHSLNIIELGGGSGWLYQYMTSLEFDIASWINIELSSIAKQFGHLIKSDNYSITSQMVNYLDENSNVNKIFYSNSVLQYEINLAKIFQYLQNCNFDFILLDDFIWTPGKSFVSFQKFYDNQIPYLFRNINEFVHEIQKIGYELIESYPYEVSFSPGWNWAIDSELEGGLHLEKSITLIFKSTRNSVKL